MSPRDSWRLLRFCVGVLILFPTLRIASDPGGQPSTFWPMYVWSSFGVMAVGLLTHPRFEACGWTMFLLGSVFLFLTNT